MQKFVINNGNFSANGAFSGYTAKGERIHIFARQMESLGYSKGDDIDYPFYVIAEKKSYAPRLDASGKPIANADGTLGVTDRLTATAIFKTIDKLGQAYIDDATLDARIDQMVNNAVQSFKLDASAVGALANTF